MTNITVWVVHQDICTPFACSVVAFLRRITLIRKPSLSNVKCPSQTRPSFKLHRSHKNYDRSENVQPNSQTNVLYLFTTLGKQWRDCLTPRERQDDSRDSPPTPPPLPPDREQTTNGHVFRTTSTVVTFLLNNAQVSWVIDGRWEIHLSVKTGTRRVYVSVVGFACRVTGRLLSPGQPPRDLSHCSPSDRFYFLRYMNWWSVFEIVGSRRTGERPSIVNHWCAAMKSSGVS